MRKYPHLLPQEVALWERWLALHGDEWERYEYDVHVGRGVDPGPGVPEPFRSLAIRLTQKRIDVVAWRAGIPWILEIKPEAGLSAFGQLLAYERLWRLERGWRGPIRKGLVCAHVDPDTRRLLEAEGVVVWELGYG